MAKPIELGLVLEGEDARVFLENEKRPPTKPQIELFEEAKLIHKRIRGLDNRMTIGDMIVLFLVILMSIACVIVSIVCVMIEDYLSALAVLVLYVVVMVCIVADRKFINCGE